MPDPAPLELEDLDLGQLAYFYGQFLNDRVLERLHKAGFTGIRLSHGYLVQHVVEGDCSVTELAERMGVTQQAVSKVVAELSELDYLEQVPADDARVRRVRLSARGRAMLGRARRIRAELERVLLRGASRACIREAKALLAKALQRLGGTHALRRRRVRPPSDDRRNER